MGGFVKAALDPAGILGNWDDTSAPIPQDDGVPSVWQRPGGFIGGMMRPVWEAQAQADAHNKVFGGSATQSPGDRPGMASMLGEGKANPKPFEAQWQYTAGKGPQWTEPKLENKQWSAQVNTGPAKGNRF